MNKIFTLSSKPISVNSMRRGRTYLTTEYERYGTMAQWELFGQHPIKNESKELTVEIRYYLKSLYRADVDNYAKGVIDACTKAGLWEDDRYIMCLILKKIKSDKEYVEIEILLWIILYIKKIISVISAIE